jgi:hypothetical protein
LERFIKMEMFAAKVRYGGGPRFDPMLEERGGWAAREDPKTDTEMTGNRGRH